MKKRKTHIRLAEELRSDAKREARDITHFGWRPSEKAISQLKASTGDAVAYRTTVRAWRVAGFKLRTIQKLAGRVPAN